MKYNELKSQNQTQKTRVGRGIAAGKGKTAGRGTKGQNARKSGGVRPGFEGGQNPLMQRLPKLRGFRSIRPAAEVIYTSQLDKFGATVDNHKLFEAGLTSSPFVKVKVVLNGPLTKKVTVKLQAASAAAQALIKKAGGEFVETAKLKRASKQSDDKK